MGSVLVVFMSTYGQAEKIAVYVADLARERGLDVETVDIARAHAVNVDEYDATVIVAPVYFGRHPRVIENFMRARADVLSRRPTALVSVSNSAANAASSVRANAERIARALVADCGVAARLVTTAGGALAYPRYGFFVRMMMKLIARRSGNPVDTKRVHELTDWVAVEKDFASFFGAIERVARPPAPAKMQAGPSIVDPSGVHPIVAPESTSAARVR